MDTPPLLPFRSPWNNLYFFFFFNSIVSLTILPVMSSISCHSEGIFQKPLIQCFIYTLSILYLITAWGSFIGEVVGRKYAKVFTGSDDDVSNPQNYGIQTCEKSNILLYSEAIMVLSCELFFAFFLVLRSIPNKDCPSSNFLFNWSCNPYQSVPIFPLDSAMILMILPAIFSIITKGQRVVLSLLLCIISLSSLITSAIILSSIPSIPVIFIYMLMTVVEVVDNVSQLAYIGRLYSTLQKYYDDKRHSAEKKKVDEMKDVIGNVSHDLKTVRVVS